MYRNKRYLLLASLTALTLAAGANAAPDRAQRWETTVQLVASDSTESSGNRQSSVDIDSAVGWGFGLAYNFNSQFAAGFDFSWLNPDYKATFNTDQHGLVSVDHEMDIVSGAFNGTWNMLEGPFTPYLRVDLGWTYIDSNVSNGPPVTGCWWDPWWGYICNNYYNTYDDTSFSYGIGAGLRYEFGNSWFIKGSVNHTEIDASHGFDPSFDSVRVELGWMPW